LSSEVDLLRATLDAVRRLATRTPIVLIDGPAGAGKSTLADNLVRRWPGTIEPTLVRMDDIYPGWAGLAAGSRFVTTELLEPLLAGRPAGWRRYDWAVDARAEWHQVDPSHPLIVEGCGTLSAANTRLADLCVWLDADDAVRKTRALARDRGGFDPFWDMWQEQFDAFVAREKPVSRADLILDGTALR
jgi:uridine kinase